MEKGRFVYDFESFESNYCRELVGHILHNAHNLFDTLVMYKFSKDDIYTHVAWYLMGAKDVLMLDDSVTNRDFKASQDAFNDFMDTVKKKIHYNDFLED